METRFPLDHGYMLCQQLGPRADIVFEVTELPPGLYRGCVLGKTGQLDLGALIPEGGALRLRRSLPLTKLQNHGCWPITGGRVVLSQTFETRSSNSWMPLPSNRPLFPDDPVLTDALSRCTGGLYRRSQNGIALLAFPLRLRCPFPLVPVFCFAQVKAIQGQPHLLFRFRSSGQPLPPAP